MRGASALLEILPQAVVSGLLLGGIYSVVAVGLSIIWGIMDVVNFAHGDYVMVAMYVTYVLFEALHIGPLESLPIVIAFSVLLGLATYRLVIKPIVSAPPLIQILATFGISILLRYTIQAIFSTDYHKVSSYLVPRDANWHITGVRVIISVPEIASLVGSLVFTAIAYWIFFGTNLGKQLRAVAEDKEAAATLGVDIERMNYIAWGIGIGLAGAAGCLLCLYYYIFPGVGALFTIFAFAAVALGGFGSILGTLMAAFLLGVLEVVVGSMWIPAYQQVVIFAVFIVALLARQTRRGARVV